MIGTVRQCIQSVAVGLALALSAASLPAQAVDDLAGLQPGKPARSPGSTLILVDANADMGAGSGKFDLQLQALAATARRGDDALRAAVFGGPSCGGFQMLADGQPVAQAAAKASIAPMGRRDITAALDAAAAELPAEEGGARILAIVGGPNQCLAAVCAHAMRLKAARPELVVDVIGFGLSDDEARRMDCVAANTGGRFSRADNNGLATALALALGPSSDGMTAMPAPILAAASLPEQAASDAGVADDDAEASARYADMTGPELAYPRGLRLTASLAAGSGTLSAGARYDLLRADNAGVMRLVARTFRADAPLFGVPPGRYIARVAIGEVSKDMPVVVPVDGISNRRIVLDAGRLTLTAAIANRQITHGVAFRIDRLDKPQTPVTIQGRGQAMAVLPAGRYRVLAAVDGAESASVVDVLAGGTARASLNLPAGFLRVADHAGLQRLRILKNGTPVSLPAGARGLYRLTPGEYTVVGMAGGNEVSATAWVREGCLAAVRFGHDQSLVADAAKAAPLPVLMARQENGDDGAISR